MRKASGKLGVVSATSGHDCSLILAEDTAAGPPMLGTNRKAEVKYNKYTQEMFTLG